jgi:hypothetical protein
MEGSKVTIEIAEKTKCLVCGKDKYAMQPEFICHDCWKDGKAAKLLDEALRSGQQALDDCVDLIATEAGERLEKVIAGAKGL